MALDMFGLISQFFNPVFLILATVLGYLTFLVFFYGTKHWERTQWGDRLLISIILGLMFFFGFVMWIPIIASSWMLFMRTTYLSDNLIYSISTLVFLLSMVILSLSRCTFGKPLHSTEAKTNWKKYFGKYKIMSLIKFYFFWLFFLALTAWQYPFSEFLLQRWERMFVTVAIGSFFLYSVLPLMLSNLTYMPNIKFDMFSVLLKDLKEMNIKKFSLQFIHILILFLVAFSITSFDSNIGLFTPKIALIESVNVVDDTVYLSRYENMEIVAMAYNEMTLHVIPALIPSISINFVQVANPSNSTSTEREYETKITYSDGLDGSLTSDERTLNVIIETEERKDFSAKIEYYNKLSVDSVARIEENKDVPVTTLPNGTKVKDYYFKITNLTPYDIRLKSVTLLYLEIYNITAFSYDVEWEPKAQGYCQVWNETSWAYLNGKVGPKTSLVISVEILFEEG